MILYKYMSYAAGLEMLTSNTVAFTQPAFFNDPFELLAGFDSSDNRFISQSTQDVISMGFGVLSLTRNPLNSLMWAHYSQTHRGMVVGIDVTDDFFKCPKTNVIPVQHGNIIYSNTKPDSPIQSNIKFPIIMTKTFDFQFEALELIQRLFLCKPMCWSYEEEVRVVKNLDGLRTNKMENGDTNGNTSGTFTKKLTKEDKPIFLHQIPENCFKEVYFGVNSELPPKPLLEELAERCQLFKCHSSRSSWKLYRSKLEIDDNGSILY